MLSSRAQHVGLDGPYFPTKTPIRLKGRSENAIHAGSKTVGPKGKNTAPRTPFGPSSAQPNRLLKNVLATQGKAAGTSGHRPLGDKTPFPNRSSNFDAPQDGLTKMPKLVFLEMGAKKVAAATPEMLRPSSTRKHSRSRRSGSQKFETPLNNGRHWDVGDISFGSPEVEIQETIQEDNDWDEVEYMAPNTLDIPYQPPVDFDLPDYKLLGEAFRKQVFSPPANDVEAPDMILPSFKTEGDSWNFLTLRELVDDDPFHIVEKATKPIVPSKSAPRMRPLSTLPSSSSLRPAATANTIRPRPATAAATINVKATSRAVISSRKPVISTANPAPRLPASTSKTSLKPPTLANRPTIAKVAPTGKAKPTLAPKPPSAPSTSRSTPTLRALPPSKSSKTLKPLTAEPILVRNVYFDLQDDFMFDV